MSGCDAEKLAMENAYAEYNAAYYAYQACVAANGSQQCQAEWQVVLDKLAEYNAAQSAFFACVAGIGQE